MKRNIIIGAFTFNLLGSWIVFGQASFLLQNLYSEYGINAPVFDAHGVPLAGPNYLAELWGGATPDSLAPALDISREGTRYMVPFATGDR